MQVTLTIPDGLGPRLLLDLRARYGTLEGETTTQTVNRCVKTWTKETALQVEIPGAKDTAVKAKVADIDSAWAPW